MIKLSKLTKQYSADTLPAVDTISLTVAGGEFLILLGESGCGKTTTLKMINRLIEPTSGKVEIDSRNTAAMNPVSLRRSIGYVFQEIGLFPHMTIAENIAAVPSLLGWDKKRIASRVEELLDLVGLGKAGIRERYPWQLSGGQGQRIGVARALAARPKIMLLDEPFGALDPITRDALQEEFLSLQKKLDLTVVMVTHDMMEALLLADRIAVMESGKIVALNTPQKLLADPGHAYVARLLKGPVEHADRLEALKRHE